MAEAQLPPEIYDRLRQELTWSALSHAEQLAQLRALERFDALSFCRLVGFVKEMMKQGGVQYALEISRHYFAGL